MTIRELSDVDQGGLPQAPPDIPPSVTVRPPAGRIVAGVPVNITVSADEGTHWVFIPGDDSWEPVPAVSYSETRVSIDGVEVVRDTTGGGGIYPITFATPGNHSVSAVGVSDGGDIPADPVSVHVAPAGPPVFTVISPADGLAVPLDEGGATIPVQLSFPGEPFFPLTVSITRDGITTSDVVTATSYAKPVQILPMPLGPRPITVTVADGVASSQTRTLQGRDNATPHPHVVFPQASANIVGEPDGTAHFTMHGTLADSQSGTAGGSATVQWALSPTGMRTTAVPDRGNDFKNWSAAVTLTGFGAHSIYVWGTDQAGNATVAPEVTPVSVISSFTPLTLDERLNEREYLAALLSFAQEQVQLPTDPPKALDTATLVGVLGQPADRLSQPLSAAADQGNREINQLRVPVELLRAHIAATHTPTAPGAAGEAAYRSAAYTSLLASAGTSYTELRLARGATPEFRQALAARLGIRLTTGSPDELDQLVLDGDRLTEAALETLFGLADTTGADPLRVPATPRLLTWQLNGLAVTWAEQDQHPNPPRAYAVLADPDVITGTDAVEGPKGDPIRTLLGQRTTLLADYARSLDALRSHVDAAHGLAAMQDQALPGLDLADLENQDSRGTDITPRLRTAGLTLAGFRSLRTLARLAAAGTLTEAEWADAVAILTGAHKRTLTAAWRGQESGFVLSPDFFVLTADPGPAVSPSRSDPRARSDWQSVLRGRIAERQDLIEASARAVASAEQAALPILRDALLTDLVPAGGGPVTASVIPETGEAMAALFLVDVLAGGTLRTTRLRQAIETIQSLLSAKRNAELATDHPAYPWRLADFDAFAAAWVWMGELGSWRAATMAFLFPERHLDPALLVPHAGTTPPNPLDDLADAIRGSGPFTAADANRQAARYLAAPGIGMPFAYLDPHRTQAHQELLRDLSKAASEQAAKEIFWVVPMLLGQRLQSGGDFQAALDWYWILYPYDVAEPVSIYDPINTEDPFRPDLTFPPQWTSLLNPFDLVAHRPSPYTRYTLLAIIRCHLDFADSEFTRETDESIAHARTLYVTARRLLSAPRLRAQLPTNPGEPALAIPELAALRARADVQLAKLRQGRNIAGSPRTQGFTGTATVSQPTPYRFKVLLDRAKQLAVQAGQMEAGYLAALEKYDEKNLRVFDAVKAMDLTLAQISLAGARVKEAGDAVTAATAQATKASTMATAYADAIAAPENKYEKDLLDEYTTVRDIRDGISVADTAIGIMQAAANAASLTDAVFSFGTKQALAVGISGATLARGGLEIWRNQVEAQMQANQLHAGIEQRKQEWRLQQASAEQDGLIAAAQVTVANDQVAIAAQEAVIANLQHDQAVATLKFLTDQFTNADLYQWMSTTLGGVYRYFLQQATATSRLAQAQLAFERAETEQALIRNDYWQSPAELTAVAIQPNRRGLTGAEQLQEDLTRLDQYAFSSQRRRLNLTQTFSLARLMPVEFLDFRRTGSLSFGTPTALFDADFPGHYLRLIRQVKLSVAALVPPEWGVRATLSSNGISRVTTIQDGTFQNIVVRHDPSTVALTSPVSASGVFELDVQSDMLLPFESSGVDTTWELRLPKPANPFDFSTIVDVLLTVDYTALYDAGLRDQLTARLNADRDRGADCVFSLVRDFPDQWYDLNNPADPAHRDVTLSLRDVDFPITIEELGTGSVGLQLVGTGLPDTVVTLHHNGIGGDATATGGIASTRRGNAAPWIPLRGTVPVGDWQLGFGAGAGPLFDSGQLEDVLLIVGWTGKAPAWP